jgi:hypothetical protein
MTAPAPIDKVKQGLLPKSGRLHWALFQNAVFLPPEIVHKFLLTHHKLEVMHAYTFETPESFCVGHWPRYGTPILSNVSMVAPQTFDTAERSA